MNSHGIEKIAALQGEERAEIFREAATEKKITEAAIEKDFWVCWVLHRIFSNEVLAKQVLFKGGTSLAKCHGLIERFSEDIDLILDWSLLTKEDPYDRRSNTQQDKFNKAIETNAQQYIADVMLPQLQEIFQGFPLAIKEDTPKSILLKYPKSHEAEYIKPMNELEIGPMSAMVPNDRYDVTPYCAEIIQRLVGEISVSVKAIQAIKTFWDKVTILHCEANRPKEKDQPLRYSRHYYDLFQMLGSDVAKKAMQNRKLLQEIFEFKAKFYPQSFAQYDEALAGEIKLLPPDFRNEALQKDYKQMQEMIFGDYPEWSDILSRIGEFEGDLNK